MGRRYNLIKFKRIAYTGIIFCKYASAREREREREREKEREGGRERERESYRQAGWLTDRQT